MDLDEIKQKADETFDNLDLLAGELRAAADRSPSKASAILNDPSYTPSQNDGRFIRGVLLRRSHDAMEQSRGKAMLDELSARYVNQETVSKATLGDSDAAGGWVVPNAVVDDLTKARGYTNPYRNLVTVRQGVRGLTVDIPFRSAAPSRAVIAGFGTTKDNVDLAYNGYAATFYTLARIYDLGVQFVRNSAGVAEKDVMQELGSAIGRGEAYYMREGTGSTMPYGYIPALTNGPATFRSSFSPSATTLAGSVAAAIVTAAGALMSRGRKPEAAVISGDVATLVMGQGTDTAGFFVNGISGTQKLPDFGTGTLIGPLGIPLVIDTDAATDDLVVGEWSALKLYLGQDVRVDTSDQAGDRWDKNLIGFRGEEDMAFDARPAVYSGALQMVTDVVP